MNITTKPTSFMEAQDQIDLMAAHGERVMHHFMTVKDSVQNNTFKPLKIAIERVDKSLVEWEKTLKTLQKMYLECPIRIDSSVQTTCSGSCCREGGKTPRSKEKKQQKEKTQETRAFPENKEVEQPQVPHAPKATKAKKKNNKEKEEIHPSPSAKTKEKKKAEKVALPPPPPEKVQKKAAVPAKKPCEEFTLVTRKKKSQASNSKKGDEDKKKTTKTQHPSRPLKRLPPAVVVRPAETSSPNRTINMIKSCVDPCNCDVDIRRIRVTRRGQVLVEVAEEDRNNSRNLEQAIATALGGGSSVKTLGATTLLEVRDLDPTVSPEELCKSIVSTMGCQQADVRVIKIRSAFQGTCTALIEATNDVGEKLLAKTPLRIGWTKCRIRPNLQVTRCFRCNGYGHMAVNCRGPDRSGLCRVCNRSGHKAAECKGQPECGQCSERGLPHNHPQGSHARCATLRQHIERRAKK